MIDNKYKGKIHGCLSGKEISKHVWNTVLKTSNEIWQQYNNLHSLFEEIGFVVKNEDHDTYCGYFMEFSDIIQRYGNTYVITCHQISDYEALIDEVNLLLSRFNEGIESPYFLESSNGHSNKESNNDKPAEFIPSDDPDDIPF